MAALNVGVGGAALGPAAMVFKTALLGRADAADIGVPSVPSVSCTAPRSRPRRATAVPYGCRRRSPPWSRVR